MLRRTDPTRLETAKSTRVHLHGDRFHAHARKLKHELLLRTARKVKQLSTSNYTPCAHAHHRAHVRTEISAQYLCSVRAHELQRPQTCSHW